MRRDATFHENKRWDWTNNSKLAPTNELNIDGKVGVSHNNTEGSPSDVEECDLSSIRYRSLQDVYDSCSFALTITDPCSYDEAGHQQDWKAAMDEEILSILKNDTWFLTTLPVGKKAVDLKWIYKSKYYFDGSLIKKKACLVAKDYTQIHGVGFDEVFSPVTWMNTVRFFIAVAA